jgi:hypothetical protein
MIFRNTILFASLLAALPACRSSKPETLSSINAARFDDDVVPGAYYRTGLTPTAFYDEQPDSLIGKTPTDMLGPRHVVQLLSASAGSVWARVRTEEDDIGFVKFSAIKIVPTEDRPKAPKRKINKWGEDKY